MIKGAILDLDGTLLDSMPIWNKAGEMFLSTKGIEAEPGLSKIMYSMSMTEGAKFLQERYHLDMDVDAIMEGINHTIEDFYTYQVQGKEGVQAFLEAMKQAGIKMVIATSSDRQVFEKGLARLNIFHCFERIFTSTEIGAGKDQPDIFLAAAESMGTLPKDTWVFEDALHAIQTAKNAGFKTVGVFDPSNSDNWDEIKRVSDMAVEKLSDVKFFEKICLQK